MGPDTECPAVCILLAEDETLIRETAQEFLEDAGHEVVTAEHGQQALDHVERYPGRFTCLVTDYHMPHVHGDRVIERVRTLYPGTPVVLASAFPQATTPDWRRHYQVELLVKPYSMGELVRLVNRLLL